MENKDKVVRFSDLEPRILVALRQRGPSLGINEPVSLVGMSSIAIQDTLDVVSLGGKNVPVVLVVGQTTGRVYQFALKALLPDLEF